MNPPETVAPVTLVWITAFVGEKGSSPSKPTWKPLAEVVEAADAAATPRAVFTPEPSKPETAETVAAPRMVATPEAETPLVADTAPEPEAASVGVPEAVTPEV